MALKKCFLTLVTTIEFEPKSNDTYYKQIYNSDIQCVKYKARGMKLQRKIKFFI